MVINEDYRLELYDGPFDGKGKSVQKSADSALCFRCLHTSTHTDTRLVLSAEEIDKACKDVKGPHANKKFPPGFAIELNLAPEQENGGEEAKLNFNEDVEEFLFSLCSQHLSLQKIEAGETLLQHNNNDGCVYLVAQGSFRLEDEVQAECRLYLYICILYTIG